jgi:hypothetical protein
MIMEYKTGILISDSITNIQSDTIIHNETQVEIHNPAPVQFPDRRVLCLRMFQSPGGFP